MREDKKG
ncbi:hypothetical protein L345_03055 [Ophiophagus hannah]|nr:hypothetical protein L345_03055 [Ophiophagus hannah]